MRPRVTICIPTYNRMPFLRELLESICALAGTDALSVAISDNDSQDDTQRMVASFADRLPIRYHKNGANIGADRNFMAAGDMGDGEYIWLMGDDDRMHPPGFAAVMAALTSYQPGIVIGNREDFVVSGVPIGETRWFSRGGGHVKLRNEADWFFHFRSLNSLGGLFGYLSTIIVKRELWQAARMAPNLMMGTSFAHVDTLVRAAKLNRGLLIIDRPIVLNRVGNDSFFTQSRFARMCLDIDGFSVLTERHFATRAARAALRDLMAREHDPHLTTHLTIARWLNSSDRDTAKFIRCRKQLRRPSRLLRLLDLVKCAKRQLRAANAGFKRLRDLLVLGRHSSNCKHRAVS